MESIKNDCPFPNPPSGEYLLEVLTFLLFKASNGFSSSL